MFRFLCLTSSVLALTALLQSQSRPKKEAQEDPAKLVVQMERAALDRTDKGDPQRFLDMSDPDIVYFDPGLEEPIHGLAALSAYYKRTWGPTESSGEMTNVRTQVLDDAVVLTFNYTSRPATGKVVRWNATEVYRRTPKGWRIVHTHWAFLKPEIVKTP